MKQSYTLLFLLLSVSIFSQKSGVLLYGKIKGNKNNVAYIHIINLNSKQGVASNEDGTFEIYVNLNDVLLISSLSYVNKKITITKAILKTKKIQIQLVPKVVMLDEVFLHNLSGTLINDLTKIPKNTTPKINFKYHPSDLAKITSSKYNLENRPNALAITDPTFVSGVGGSATFPDFQLEAERKLRKKLKESINVPKEIIQVLGKDYFIKNLKIPENEIYRFVSFCESKNIVDLYRKDKLLEIIKILSFESKKYHAAKK